MTTKEAFLILRTKFGTDKACAHQIGMSEQHFEALRNGRAKIPKRTASYIILQAQAVQDSSACSASGEAGA